MNPRPFPFQHFSYQRFIIFLTIFAACSGPLRAQPNAYVQDKARRFIPQHPWRSIAGTTNCVKLDGVEFVGKIVDITRDGVTINGTYGPLMQLSYYPTVCQYPDFFVAHFPFQVEDGQTIDTSEHLMAWDTGDTYTYRTIKGMYRSESRTIHKLDYGTPCGPPPALLQAQAAAAKAETDRQKRSANEAKTNAFRWLQTQSTNTDSAAAQYRLALCYLTGSGCASNRFEAMKWLNLSASSGNQEASNKLTVLRP